MVVAVAVAALLAVAAPAANPVPVHRYQTGQDVKDLQWLLAGHKPSAFKIVAYKGKINGLYFKQTATAVKNMKWRLGWPEPINADVAGSFFLNVLKGKIARPRSYFVRVTARLAALKKIEDAKRAETDCAKKVIRFARGELGVIEDPYGSNSGSRVREYQAVTGAFHAPWCVSFAQWVFKQARVGSPKAWSGAIANNSAGAFYVAGWAREHGWARSVPKPGFGVVFLDRLGHMGIVESVSSTGFTSIEGNASNRVLERFHPFGARPEVFVAVPGCDTG